VDEAPLEAGQGPGAAAQPRGGFGRSFECGRLEDGPGDAPILRARQFLCYY